LLGSAPVYVAAMRNGICVKCGAATVKTAKNGIMVGERPEPVIRPHLERGFRGIARSHSGEVWVFVCMTCGYLEWAIYDPATLGFIDDKWQAVPAQPTG
jgi:hypothetical protein